MNRWLLLLMFLLLLLLVRCWHTHARIAAIPVPENPQATPLKYFPGLLREASLSSPLRWNSPIDVSKPSWRASNESEDDMIVQFMRWFMTWPGSVRRLQRHGRINQGYQRPKLARWVWDRLTENGTNCRRLSEWTLPTRPGWFPIGLDDYVVPVVYHGSGAAFSNHLDAPTLTSTAWMGSETSLANLAKLVLYDGQYTAPGGTFEISGLADESLNNNHNISQYHLHVWPLPGSGLLFDLSFKHTSTPLVRAADYKYAIGFRVVYARENRCRKDTDDDG